MAQLLGSACTPSWSPGRGYAERTLVKLHPIRLFGLRVPVAAGVESPGHLCVPVAAGAETPAGEVMSGEIDIDRGSLIDGYTKCISLGEMQGNTLCIAILIFV